MGSSYDTQFNTLIRSLHDNFLQFKLTGGQTYQNSYTNAQAGIEKILSELENSVESQKSQITNFYKTDVEGKLKDIQSRSSSLQHGLVEQNDELTAAKIRQSQSTSIPTPSLTSRYIAVGSLIGVTLLLSFL
jgi:hypothetical protein